MWYHYMYIKTGLSENRDALLVWYHNISLSVRKEGFCDLITWACWRKKKVIYMIFTMNLNSCIKFKCEDWSKYHSPKHQKDKPQCLKYCVPPACQFHYKLMVLPRQPFSAVSGDQGVSLTSALTEHWLVWDHVTWSHGYLQI